MDETSLSEFTEAAASDDIEPDEEVTEAEHAEQADDEDDTTASDDKADTAASDHEEPANEPPVPATEPVPAATTFSWAPQGECARCESPAPRRFRDADELVCPDCKDWTETPTNQP